MLYNNLRKSEFKTLLFPKKCFMFIISRYALKWFIIFFYQNTYTQFCCYFGFNFFVNTLLTVRYLPITELNLL